MNTSVVFPSQKQKRDEIVKVSCDYFRWACVVVGVCDISVIMSSGSTYQVTLIG